jgi:uncharacterized cupin superfamily protein
MAPTLKHYPSAKKASLHPYTPQKDIHIGDTSSSISTDPNTPITSGFFTLDKGCKATTTFAFSEYKYVLEGTFIVTDQEKNRFVGKPGDVIFIPRGSTITFETENGGKTFFVSSLLQNLIFFDMSLTRSHLIVKVAQRAANQARLAGNVAKL